jgi:hypothetical protein
VFGRFQSSLGTYNGSPDKNLNSQYKTIPTFLTLFIFGFLYELLLTWDALRLKNTIQVIGICVANLALLIYSALQYDQIESALTYLQTHGALKKDDADYNVWTTIKPFLLAIPVIISAASVIMGYMAWKLYQEFAWNILKQIGADLRMKKRFLHYQVNPDETSGFGDQSLTMGSRFTSRCSSSISSSSSGSRCNSSSS